MALNMLRFASGDTDYIAKLNANFSLLGTSFDTLILSIEGGIIGGSGAGSGALLNALFNSTTTLIGVGSYVPTGVGANLTVQPGAAFFSPANTVVQYLINTVLSFSGQPAATYYVTTDATGVGVRSTSSTDALYSVVWTGSAFGAITRVARVLFDAAEENAARISAENSITYATLDARLEAIEAAVGDAGGLGAALDTDVTLAADSDVLVASQHATKSYVDATLGAGTSVRKVGLSMDGSGEVITTGVKGAIQVDFAGTIIGWSLVADQVGSISISIDKHASSAPPAVPAIPNTTTDKISASAPIALSAAQAASGGTAAVSTWTTAVAIWDVIQFHVTAVTVLTRATLYLRIQE